MIIQSLQLQNYCQHRARTIEFSPGLNLLVGPNGSGKSNILRALQLTLTGDAGGDRNKQDDINQAAEAHDSSFVEARLTHDGSALRIRRSLRPNANKLTVPGKVLTSVTEINNELWTRLGVTKKQITDYIFVSQRKIDEVFDHQKAERAALLAPLFGLTQAAAAHKAIGEFLTSVQVPTTLLDVDKLRQTQQELQAEAKQLLARIATLTKERDAKLAAIDEDIQSSQHAFEEMKDEIAAARKGLQQWQVYHASKKVRDAAEAALKAARAKPEPADPPEPTVEDLSAEENKEYSDLRRAIATKQEAIKALQTKTNTCAACGQPMPDAQKRAAKLQALQMEVAELSQAYQELDYRYNVWTAYDEQASDHAVWEHNIERARKAVEELKSLDAPQTPEAELQETADLDEGLRADIACLNARRVQQVADWETRLSQARIVLERNELQQDNTTRQLEEHRMITERTESIREATTHLHAVRRIFHHEECPRMCSYTYIEQMLAEINETLGIFDAPYRVIMDEHLGFIAKFLDGERTQPDKRLSVGERIVLAMAFRITVNSTFASQVGVLIMDEPTAGLDEHNLECLPKALERLKELSTQRGLQVLFVTHEPRITNLFDNVIELPAA